MDNLLFFYPALLFPAILFMIISFGNRYTAFSSLIRKLHDDFLKEDSSTKHNKIIYKEIINLRVRLILIRTVQTGSGLVFMSDLISIFFSYNGNSDIAFNTFGLAVIIFFIVIAIFIAEIQLSSKSLNLHLSAMIDNRK